MANEQDKLERELRNIYADYDQTVDVVSCWQSVTDWILRDHKFYRFGKFQNGLGDVLTPDFAIAHPDAESMAAPGALICDVKKLPNPFPEDASESELEEAQARFSKAVDEVFKYGDELKYITQRLGLPRLTFAGHDVVLLTPTEVSDNAYNYLKRKLPAPFDVGRPLVLVEYTYNQSDNLERYIFKWKLGECNSQFANPILRERMILKGQPLRGFPKHFIPYKIRHITCNDPVPPVYLLSFLWVEVFVKLLSEDQLDEWQEKSTAVNLEIDVSIPQILEILRTAYDTSLSTTDLKRALDELVTIKKAKPLGSAGAYRISFSNLAGRTFAETVGEQEGIQKRLELREYGRVFATLLAKKELKQATRPRIRVRRSRVKFDYPILPFDR